MKERIHALIDTVASFFGSVPFLYVFTLIVIAWIALNTAAPAWMHFDNFPFAFFTLALSLLAIYLSVFILISQNRQGDRDRAHTQRQERENKERQEADIELNRKEDAQEQEILSILAKQNETLNDVIQLLNLAQPTRATQPAKKKMPSQASKE